MSKRLKFSIFSLIFVMCIGTLFVNLNKDVEKYESDNIQQDIFTVKEYEGKIAVFKNDDSKPTTIYDSYISLLPESDRIRLQKGITVDNTNDLQKIIEDYTS